MIAIVICHVNRNVSCRRCICVDDIGGGALGCERIFFRYEIFNGTHISGVIFVIGVEYDEVRDG